jgi:hypothetical protein
LFKSKNVLITGGSSGIGFELARVFLKDGGKLILVSSNEEKLSSAADSLEKEFERRPRVIVKDLAKPSAAFEIFDELSYDGIEPDVLVNNAGIGLFGKFHAADPEKVFRLIDVNVKALVSLTRLFVPLMVKKKSGWVLNVSSIAAFQPIPLEAIYASTKAFVLLFTESLANELNGSGVNVTCLCPGMTDTPFFKEETFSSSGVGKRKRMHSRQVAEFAVRALKRNKTLAIPGLHNKTVPFLERFFPRKWVAQIARMAVE